MKGYEKAWSWFKKFWWIVVAAVAVIVGFLLRGLFSKPSGDGGEKPPDFVTAAKEKVAAAEEATNVKKAEVIAETKQKQGELAEIKKTEDPRARRQKLAAWLKDNL
jgi:cytoskeletal protein RodZ